MGAKVLVVGSGGREHAIAWKLSRSERVGSIVCAPGNAGTMLFCRNVPVKAGDAAALVALAKSERVDLVVPGPEAALVTGLADSCTRAGIPVFGPSRRAAAIESSKSLAKHLMEREGIPTAEFRAFLSHARALDYVRRQVPPVVVKADGLAAGKGVFVCRTLAEAEEALRKLMVDRVFGDNGAKVVVEECLTGVELSAHAFCDRNGSFAMMPFAQDHKTLFEGGVGPNTGGMGCVAPVPFAGDREANEAAGIVSRALDGLSGLNADYCGWLFPGLMSTAHGLHVLEFNARGGDPETQVYMRLLKSDLYEIMMACVEGRLDEMDVEWHRGSAVCVVLAAPGYPDSPIDGLEIEGIEMVSGLGGVQVFHSGTAFERGRLVTAGGRVLSVTATGCNLEEARARAYGAVSDIYFVGMRYRRDIGAYASGTDRRRGT